MAQIVAVVPDLMFGSRVRETLRSAGHEVELVAGPDLADLSAAELVVADLNEVSPEALSRAERPVLGFYSHVDAETRRRAEAADIDLIVPRSRMAREMAELVGQLLA